MLDPARLREMLSEFLIGSPEHVECIVEYEDRTAGGSLVNGDDEFSHEASPSTSSLILEHIIHRCIRIRPQSLRDVLHRVQVCASFEDRTEAFDYVCVGGHTVS